MKRTTTRTMGWWLAWLVLILILPPGGFWAGLLLMLMFITLAAIAGYYPFPSMYPKRFWWEPKEGDTDEYKGDDKGTPA